MSATKPVATISDSFCGLRVLSPAQAAIQGFRPITMDINSRHEIGILRQVSKDRDPSRTVIIATGNDNFQLCVLRNVTNPTEQPERSAPDA